MAKLPVIQIDLSSLNHTELVLLARWCGLPASRGMPRDLLIQSLETFDPVDTPMPFDKKRTDLKKWLQRRWDRLQMQMPKKVCPNCDQCRDLQILDCYTRNEANISPGPARR